MSRKYSVSYPEDKVKEFGENNGHVLFDAVDGCTNGCRCGVSYYRATELNEGAAHDDQEGVLILEGHGIARIDGDIIKLYPGVCVMIPPGVNHCMITDEDCEYVKSFWFHSAN